jgi:hypothetical protein
MDRHRAWDDRDRMSWPITEATREDDGWTLCSRNECCYIADERNPAEVTPHVGDVVTYWATPPIFGITQHGRAINGHVLWYDDSARHVWRTR